MNQISENNVCPLKSPQVIPARERLGEAGRGQWARSRGAEVSLVNQPQESGVWRVSRAGSVPRKESGGGILG